MVTSYTIDVKEVLRYLGAKPNNEIEGLISECSQTLIKTASPKYIWRELELDGLKIADCGIAFEGSTASNWLDGCSRCAFLAATLGIEADMLIRRAQNTDMARAVVYDACATDLIEKACDRAQEEIRECARERGMTITDRFSPGYGDFPLEFQKSLCGILDTTRRLGVCLTDNFLLTPTKSVTAIVGMGNNENRFKRGCSTCVMRNRCKFKSNPDLKCAMQK